MADAVLPFSEALPYNEESKKRQRQKTEDKWNERRSSSSILADSTTSLWPGVSGNATCPLRDLFLKTDLEKIKEMNPKGIILTGGPNSCYEEGAATCMPQAL